jgi:hypothetical protein
MASTPMPDEGVNPIPASTMAGQALPTSEKFWGRSRPAPVFIPNAPRGFQAFPKLMYHPQPEKRAAAGMSIYQVAENEEQHKEAVENGWLDKPATIHLEMLQNGDGGRSGKRLPVSVDWGEKEEKAAKKA